MKEYREAHEEDEQIERGLFKERKEGKGKGKKKRINA